MLRKLLLFIAGLIGCAVAIAGPLFLLKISQFKAMAAAGAAAAAAMPPTTVTASPASGQKWENLFTTTGSLKAVQGVTVGAEVPGKVVKLGFEAGSAIKEGDLLVQLDSSTEEAQLHAAEASAALAQANLARARELRETNTNSPAELDAAEAQAKQASAQVENYRSIIAKKTIRAPFAGRSGIRLVNLGEVLREGDPITTLQTLDPIYVNFSLPQQRLPQLAEAKTVRVTTDAAPGRTFEGKINAISPEIDMATRNIRVQATIDNADEQLRPGMFANVDIVLPTHTEAIAVPATAILFAPYGNSVFVVDEKKNEETGKIDRVLRQQFVRLGGTRGDFVDVVDGLKAGETVVTSGVFKLRAGMPVVIDNKLAPNAQLDPKPDNA